MTSPVDLVAAVIRGDVVDWPGERSPERADRDCAPERLAAHGTGPRARSAPEQASIPEAAFVETAIRHDVDPLVVWQLRRAGTFDRWPDAIREPLARRARDYVLLEAAGELEVRRVIGALASGGVPSLLFKGAALAYARYPEPWLRPRNDADVLIRPRDRAAADRVLGDLGYAPAANALEGDLVNYQVPYAKTDRLGIRHAFDIHWRVSNRPLFADILSFDEIAADSIPLPALGEAARGAGDLHALLHACVHLVGHHRNPLNLGWFYDVHLLATHLGEAGLRQFAGLARAKRVAAIGDSTLRSAAAYFATPLPQDVLDHLAIDDEPSAAYLGRTPWHGDPRLYDLRTVVGWRAKLRLIREIALPSSRYLLEEYDVTNRALVPALHVHRLARGTWRLLRRFAQ